MDPISRLHQLGQSLWLDYIRRDLLRSGQLAHMVAEGQVRGVTSNPTIFEQAISEGDLYTASMRPMAHAGWSHARVFDALALDDIREATGIFLPLYEATNGEDGYVSIEVSPDLANDSEETLREAQRLWEAVNRPNVMIKIPATQAGVPAIEQAILEGINVNVTLIFSLQRYAEVIDAYLRGLEGRLERGLSLDHVASVASFFVSRVDTKVDALLEEILRTESPKAARAAALSGKIAIANAKLAYAQFKGAFGGKRFGNLQQHGARVQRPLWASTSTKNPAYPDTYYVDNLIGAQTVNTVPPETLEAFRDHGEVELTLEQNLSDARGHIEALASLGIFMQTVTDELEQEGVDKFARSYASVLKTVAKRAHGLRKELGPLASGVEQALEDLEGDQVERRLWTGDASTGEAQGKPPAWIAAVQEPDVKSAELESLADQIRLAGVKQVVMLAADESALIARTFGHLQTDEPGSSFVVHDGIDTRRIRRRAAPAETLYLAADRSGASVAVRGLLEYYWSQAQQDLGTAAGERFVAITEGGSALEALAKRRGFRSVFNLAPAAGGYGALTLQGLLPAAVAGVQVRDLLAGGLRMARECGPDVDAARNPGLYLGALLSAAARAGRDKITLLTDAGLEHLTSWIGYLLMSSCGPALVPIVAEPAGPARVYGEDRLLVYLRSDGDLDPRVRGWIRARLPVVIIEAGTDGVAIGAEILRWQMASAVACQLLGIHPTESHGDRKIASHAERLLNALGKKSALPELSPLYVSGDFTLWGNEDAISWLGRRPRNVLSALLKDLAAHKALMLVTFLPEDRTIRRALDRLSRIARDRWGLATSVVHSCESLLAAASGEGAEQPAVLVVTKRGEPDLELPGKSYSLDTLRKAQVLGCLHGLWQAGRTALALEFSTASEFSHLVSSVQVKERKQGKKGPK